MNELIKITEYKGNQAVSARDLHKFLEITERFSSWFERMLQYGFVENQDFTSAKSFTLVNNGAQREIDDYALTLDCAKEISMIQRSKKGKEAREYFIACEKRLRAGISLPQNYKEALKALVQEVEAKERLQAQNELQAKELEKQAPKVAYYDEVLTSQSTYNANQIAKELGMSAETMNKLLHKLEVQYKQGGQWLLYRPHQNKGYTKTVTHTYTNSQGQTCSRMSTVWTEKGRAFIHSLIQ